MTTRNQPFMKIMSALCRWLSLAVLLSCSETQDNRSKSSLSNVVDACGNVIGQSSRNEDGKKVFKAQDNDSDDVRLQKECDSADAKKNVLARSGVVEGIEDASPTLDLNLSSIRIELASAELVIGQLTSFKVTGVTTEGETQDVTSVATVVSSSPETVLAKISEGVGSIESFQSGSARVTANFGSLSAATQVNVSTAVVQKVFVGPPFVRMVVGQKVPLSLSAMYSDGVHRALTSQAQWNSSAPTITRVAAEEATFFVEGMRAGNSVVQATYSSLTGKSDISVELAVYSEVELVSDSVGVYEDASTTPSTWHADLPKDLNIKFHMKGKLNDGFVVEPVPSVDWIVSDNTFATVNDEGVVRCLKDGVTQLSAQLVSATQSLTLHCHVAALGSIAVSPATATIPVGFGRSLQAIGTYTTAASTFLVDVTGFSTWVSAKPEIVSVQQSKGKVSVKAEAANAVAVRVEAKFGTVSGYAEVTPKIEKLTDIAINIPDRILRLGDAVTATAIASFESGATLDVSEFVDWSTADPAVVYVQSDANRRGTLYAVSAGGVKLSAKFGNIDTNIDVGVISPASALALSPMNPTIPFNREVPFAASYKASPTITVPVSNCMWTSSAATIATIDAQGKAKGVSEGAARINCAAYGLNVATDVMVTGPQVTSVAITPPSSTSIIVGATLQLSATATREDGTTSNVITWSSADSTKATVSDSGLVTGVAPGPVVIRATVSGTSSQITLTVNVIGSVANVMFNPTGGIKDEPAMVALSTATQGAQIFYTTNGSVATSQSTPYTGEIQVSYNMTIHAIATKAAYNNSQDVSAIYSIRAAAPTANLPPGSYSSQRSVTLMTTTDGAQIYYTTDESNPASSSTALPYSQPIEVSVSKTIKAVTKKSNMENSTIASFAYSISGAVASVTFNPAAGTQTSPVNVGLSTATQDAEIRYTLDGSTPTSSSFPYTGSIAVDRTTTIKAIALKTGWTTSAPTTATYTYTVATPQFTPAPGGYASTQQVMLSSATTGARIFYTTNESNPADTNNPNRIEASGAVVITTTKTIRAVAIKDGFSDSAEASGTYTINGSVSPVTFSPESGQKTGTIVVSLQTLTPNSVIRYTTDGSAPTTSSPVYPGSFPVSTNTTVRAIAMKEGFGSSSESSIEYSFKLPAPTFSVSGGSYPSAQDVLIHSSGPSDAVIYFTTNDSSPADENNLQRMMYVRLPIRVSVNATLKAVLVKPGMDSSDIAAATYEINGSAAPVSFTPNSIANSPTAPVRVTMTSATPNAVIKYTTNGSDPQESNNSPLTYSQPIDISSYARIRAIATATSFANSGETSAEYSFKVAQPTFDPPPGTSATAQRVCMTSETAGSPSIAYTTTGGDPNGVGRTIVANGSCITISSTATLRAVAIKTGWNSSDERSGLYTITGTVANVSFSPVGGLQSGSGPIQVALSTTTPLSTILYRLDGNDPQENVQGTYAYGGEILVSRGATIKAKAIKSNWNSSAVTSVSYSFKVATPTTTTNSGAYATAQTMTLSAATPSSTIFYTDNGQDPATHSSRIQFTQPIVVSQSQTINAVAVRDGFINSDLLTRTFTINGPVADVTFSPLGGLQSGNGPVSVTLSSASPNSAIRYTTDGSNPVANSPLFGAPIQVSQFTIIKAFAEKTGHSNSQGTTSTYSFKAASPTFSLAAGTYPTTQMVVLSTTTPNAQIYYTQDGTEPTSGKNLYQPTSNGIVVDRTMTIRAISIKSGFDNSLESARDYVINTTVSPVSISPNGSARNDDLSVTVTLTTPTTGASIFYTTAATGTPSVPYNNTPFSISQNSTLRAYATKVGSTDSSITSASFSWTAVPPVANVAAGTYSTAQNVALSTTTAGAQILYTTNGTDPATSGLNYATTITGMGLTGIAITSTKTLRAITRKPGYNDSAQISRLYTITGVVSQPMPNIATTGQPITAPFMLGLSSSTPNALIYYTTDGSTPSPQTSTLYSGQFEVNRTMPVQAIATLAGWTNSAITSVFYSFQAAMPILSPASASGTDLPVNVAFTSASPGVTFRYTTDNSLPIATSPSGSNVSLTVSKVLKVMATRAGWSDSPVAIGSYTVRNSPLSVSLSNQSVAEGLPAGTVVGMLSAVDADVGETFTYALDNTTGAFPDNTSFQIVGNTLKTAAVFNTASRTLFSIRIKVTDSSGLSRTGDFVIQVHKLLPTNFRVAALSGSTIDLAWTDNSTSETGYRIYLSTNNSTFSLVGTVSTNAVSFLSTGLSPSTTYYYRISATNAQGETAQSASVVGTTLSQFNILSFTASPQTYLTGGSTTLSFQTSLAANCSIAAAGLTFTNVTTASKSVSPTTTTTYTLNCTGVAGGSATLSVTVTVKPLPTISLTAMPQSMASGSTTNIIFNSSYALPACSLSEAGVVIQNFVNVSSFSKSVAPTTTKIYTVVCSVDSSAATTTASTTVTIFGISSFVANPSSVQQGTATILSWASSGMNSCSIRNNNTGLFLTANGSQTLSTNGSISVVMNGAYTFTLTCTANGQSVSRTLSPPVFAY